MMRFLVGAMLCSASLILLAQQPAQPLATEHETPLPDIAPMMQQVISKEHASEAMRQDYLVLEEEGSVEGLGRSWSMGKSWTAMSEEGRDSEVFWLQGVRVSRLVRVSGFKHHDQRYGHTLSSDELHCENARIDAELAQVAKARAAGDTDGERKAVGIQNEIRMSRFLELGTFSNPRRGDDQRRNTIVVDYKGGPCVGACTPLDTAAQYIAGTLWIDEEDLAVTKFEGIFTDTWIEPGDSGWKAVKGSKLTYWGRRVEGGFWFPMDMWIETTVSRGSSSHTRSVGFFFKDYRRFRVTSTILPDFALVPDEALPETPPAIPTPQ
jgi:hypothetical protein